MTLKTRISTFTTSLFSVLFALTSLVVVLLFSDFRQEEFEKILREKAISSIRLYVDLKESDQTMLKSLDKQKIDAFFSERTLIFDSQYTLVYSSLDESKITWTKTVLDQLSREGNYYQNDDEIEMYGVQYSIGGQKYYSIVSAYDNIGRRKLKYLITVLSFAFVIFTFISWLLTKVTIRNLLLPLDEFLRKITTINERNLDARVEVKEKKNEIDFLAHEFNMMLERIDLSLKKQVEFTANASHELRTPISRIIAQIENRLNESGIDQNTRTLLGNMLEDANQLSELIHSLLILSKSDNTVAFNQEMQRLDDIMYTCIDRLKLLHADCKVMMDVHMKDDMDEIMEIKGSRTLLEIVFMNLLRNAYAYSDNKHISIHITQERHRISCSISNTGELIDEEDREHLFEPFMRGKNALNSTGFGLGLRIVHRILMQQQGEIHYSVKNDTENVFTISFQA